MIKFNNYIYNIFWIISISIILRLFLLNDFGDAKLDNEWGTLFYNLKYNKIFAFRSFDGVLVPTVYMPPLYAYFILWIDILFVNNENYLINTILIIQIFLSAVSIFIFYKINLFFFSNKISLFSSFLFCIFPLYVYSSLQISSVSIQIFLGLIFLFLILKIMNEKNNFKNLFILGFITGLCMLLRGEFIIIFLFSLIYLKILRKINVKQFLIIILTTVITISPYLIRNYLNFEKVTITKSFGYNLWKGNNIDSTVEGSESALAFQSGDISEKIDQINIDNYYDFNFDKIFLNYSLELIRQDPFLFVERYVKKFFSFLFFNVNSEYPNYYNLFNIIPLILLTIIFIPSVIFAYQKNTTYYYLVLKLLLTVGIFSFFFILPRYKLIILPIQLILINFLIVKILNLIKKN